MLVLSQMDIMKSPEKDEAIAISSFPLDSQALVLLRNCREARHRRAGHSLRDVARPTFGSRTGTHLARSAEKAAAPQIELIVFCFLVFELHPHHVSPPHETSYRFSLPRTFRLDLCRWSGDTFTWAAVLLPSAGGESTAGR
jgi:hypothetical protein